MSQKTRAMCPVCGDSVVLDAFMDVGSRVVCRSCDAILKVLDMDPCELGLEEKDLYGDHEEIFEDDPDVI